MLQDIEKAAVADGPATKARAAAAAATESATAQMDPVIGAIGQEISIPSELPPDIKHISDCQKYSIPMKLLAFRDSALLPFILNEQYEAVFLGFFMITSLTVSGHLDIKVIIYVDGQCAVPLHHSEIQARIYARRF